MCAIGLLTQLPLSLPTSYIQFIPSKPRLTSETFIILIGPIAKCLLTSRNLRNATSFHSFWKLSYNFILIQLKSWKSLVLLPESTLLELYKYLPLTLQKTLHQQLRFLIQNFQYQVIRYFASQHCELTLQSINPQLKGLLALFSYWSKSTVVQISSRHSPPKLYLHANASGQKHY